MSRCMQRTAVQDAVTREIFVETFVTSRPAWSRTLSYVRVTMGLWRTSLDGLVISTIAYVFANLTTAILNNNPDLQQVKRNKGKKSIASTCGYSIDEVEDIVASPDCSRLIIRRERLTGSLEKTKDVKEAMWQLVTAAHSGGFRSYCPSVT